MFNRGRSVHFIYEIDCGLVGSYKHAVIISTQTTNTHCSVQLWSIFPHEYFCNLITSLLAHCLVKLQSKCICVILN